MRRWWNVWSSGNPRKKWSASTAKARLHVSSSHLNTSSRRASEESGAAVDDRTSRSIGTTPANSAGSTQSQKRGCTHATFLRSWILGPGNPNHQRLLKKLSNTPGAHGEASQSLGQGPCERNSQRRSFWNPYQPTTALGHRADRSC